MKVRGVLFLMKNLRICLAQINPIVGDLKGNSKKIISFVEEAKDRKADIAVFPELCLSGYPPEDLLLKPHFIKDNEIELNRIIRASKSIFIIVGFPYLERGKLFNAAAMIYNGRLIDVCKKVFLPNYGVFDEKRYFSHGETCNVVDFGSKSDFIYKKLLDNKIKVKYFNHAPMLENSFRIAVPKLENTLKVLEVLKVRPTIVFDMDGVLIDASKSLL